MKNILSICTFLLAFGTLPLWGQSQDPLNEDQTTVRILEGDNSDPSIVRYGKSYYLVHSSFVYTELNTASFMYSPSKAPSN